MSLSGCRISVIMLKKNGNGVLFRPLTGNSGMKSLLDESIEYTLRRGTYLVF